MVSVDIRNLTKRFGDTTVIPGLDLHLDEGEFVTLLGPSGCGKTTTLRCVAGLERPTSGRIALGDRVAVDDDGTFLEPNRRELGMVFQSYALWPHMTVFGNVAYPLKTNRTPRAERGPTVLEALERVGLARFAARNVATLSGGQQQRVALARAIVGRPQLLLFDEPLSNLDTKLRASMRTELQLLHRTLGMTSLYVTHDQLEAMTLSDRVVVMNQGVIQQEGSPEEVYASPANPFVADFVGFENLLSGQAVDGAVRLGGDVVLRGRVMRRVPNGQPAQIAFRSNSVAVTADTTGPGIVLNSTFLGDQRELLIDLGGQQIRARVELHAVSGDVRAGDRVSLRPRPESALIYPGEAPASTSTTAIGSLVRGVTGR